MNKEEFIEFMQNMKIDIVDTFTLEYYKSVEDDELSKIEFRRYLK